MHVHLPKPLHGWRAFAGEVAIIVVGVLVALFFEQVVERWEWRQKVEAAEQAMMRETFWDNAPEMIQRASIQPCINAQLDSIRSAAESGRSRPEIVGLVDRLYLPFITYDSLAQRDATASDISTHMSRARANLWTQVYAMVPMIDATSAAEIGDAAKIRALRRIGGPLSDAEQIQLLQGIETVRADGLRIMAGVQWSMSVLPQLHGTVDPERLGEFMADARSHYGACARNLPADWPRTPLPPLPADLAPGVAQR